MHPTISAFLRNMLNVVVILVVRAIIAIITSAALFGLICCILFLAVQIHWLFILLIIPMFAAFITLGDHFFP